MTWEDHVLAGEDLGGDHYVKRSYLLPDGRRVTYPAGADVPEGARFIGLMEHHKTPDGKWCGGWVGFKNVEGSEEASVHELVSEDPLTVSPSLGCRSCPSHGYIREGKWVPA